MSKLELSQTFRGNHGLAFTLAGATHATLSKNNRKLAFTLAEVLITLGIIGVVAAITLPTLIANYQKQVWVNQLKNYYSTWSQAFQKILADEGVDRLSDSELFNSINGTEINYSNPQVDNKLFFNGLKKYIKFETSLRNVYLSLNYLDIITPDGMRISDFAFKKKANGGNCDIIKNLGGRMCDFIGYFTVDINGSKGPNIGGRDIFKYYLSDNGKLYPAYGKDFAILITKSDEWESSAVYWKIHNSPGSESCTKEFKSANNNFGCAARIMENGWKMDY